MDRDELGKLLAQATRDVWGIVQIPWSEMPELDLVESIPF